MYLLVQALLPMPEYFIRYHILFKESPVGHCSYVIINVELIKTAMNLYHQEKGNIGMNYDILQQDTICRIMWI